MKRTPEVGDYITFTCTTRGSGKKTVRRKIVQIQPDGTIGVRYDGWNPFWLTKSLGDKVHKLEKA